MHIPGTSLGSCITITGPAPLGSCITASSSPGHRPQLVSLSRIHHSHEYEHHEQQNHNGQVQPYAPDPDGFEHPANPPDRLPAPRERPNEFDHDTRCEQQPEEEQQVVHDVPDHIHFRHSATGDY